MEHAIQIVFLHLTWLFKKFSAEDAQDTDKVVDLKMKRDRGKAIFEKLALNGRSNSAESVRRQVSHSLFVQRDTNGQAFIAYLNIHMLFSNRNAAALPAAKAVPMHIEDEAQHRLGGAFAAAAERYASDREEQMEETEQNG